ncbi:hypothetical protein J1N35_044652 [Gossypium stocksii]|uniref:Reverse transcriptase domain-containing protein n=1 Tax=Gossypium stocksii TaxID=47602 RepID=A0A9D3U9W9_9ROSI|nr:hypothetical protein J1N35_044652 [Gossypium stocksii]
MGDEVVSEFQFAFISGRNILNSVLIANDIINHMKRRGVEGVTFKVDFQKAYDSMDRDFFIFVMESMSFGERWSVWIRRCISSATISILVNDAPTNRFYVKRGLAKESARLGDVPVA